MCCAQRGIPHTASNTVPANVTPHKPYKQKQVLPRIRSSISAEITGRLLIRCLSNLKMQGATKMNLISFKRMLFGLNIIVKEAWMSSIMIYNAALTRPSEVKKNSHVKTRKEGCWIWIKHRLAYISEWIGSTCARTHVKANDLQWPGVTKIQQLLYCKWITVDYDIYRCHYR